LELQDAGVIRGEDDGVFKREDFNEQEEHELVERIKETIEVSYDYFGAVARSILDNCKWKNLFKVEIDLLGDHCEKYF
jgi:hypothetical protein